uniref:Lipocalin/cytosolic fatty-acid binding domain-containing protein n=1 Tax=Triatoma rubida TaxID=162364 RepID=G8JKD6_9HEMI
MKTIVALTFFAIVTFVATAKKVEYGGGTCHNSEVGAMVNFDPKTFFSGTWYLTYATQSTRVTLSTICRNFNPKVNDDGTIEVTYEYYENGGSDNLYSVTCTGNKEQSGGGVFNFKCNSKNGRGEVGDFNIDVSFLATDYNTYGIVYRCVKTDLLTEDNVFLIHRQLNPNEEEVNKILKPYELTLDKFISRKDATCTNK